MPTDAHSKPARKVNFQDTLKRHLIAYKLDKLNISDPGFFLYRGKNVQRDHILPIEHKFRNLFEEAEPHARQLLRDRRNPLRLHRYFHHLNSSQAFAFNLFFPYFTGGPDASSALLRALGQNATLVGFKPEDVPDPEEGSNIDMVWNTDDGIQTFCEVKLSESDFGKAADDPRHRTKLKNTYGVLAEHLEPGRFDGPAFFDAYQFNRNVWHMIRAKNNRLIFLLPRANAGLWGLVHELGSGVVPHTRERISVMAIEDVIGELCGDSQCPKHLREYANKLKQKYLP
jgi:restriction endonuclease-like protein